MRTIWRVIRSFFFRWLSPVIEEMERAGVTPDLVKSVEGYVLQAEYLDDKQDRRDWVIKALLATQKLTIGGPITDAMVDLLISAAVRRLRQKQAANV